jgi:hypothetical protein
VNEENTMRRMLASILLLGILAGAGFGAAGPAGQGAVTLSFERFYDHAEMTRALRSLAEVHPGLMTLESVGKSAQGRDIWAVTLNNPKTGPAERKPGYYVDGNIHGNEIQGGEVALYIIDYLLKNYGRTEFATRLLDTRAFYLVPTMNPDGRDAFLHAATDSNSPRSGLVPYDDDRDGLADEDGPDDLDGDGAITMMRKKVPGGPMKLSPDDPRLLIPVKPGEKGDYVMLGSEGIDNDGDGLVNEDGPGGYDMNRNFAYNWQPEYVQRGAGPYPFCWPETQAVRDFVLAHPNIAGAQSFHNFGGMILRGPGAKNLGEYNPADIRVYDFIGQEGQRILPGYRYVTVYKDMYTVYGGTLDFLYAALGIFTFSNELDFSQDQGIPAAPKARGGSEEEDEDVMSSIMRGGGLEELRFHDLVRMGEEIAPWKPYHHPLYGDIEIGGIKQMGRRVPAPFRLPETCHRNAAFVLYHADQLPRLVYEKTEVRSLDGGLWQVDLRLRNEKATPTMSAQAVAKKLFRPDRLAVKGGATLIAAGLVTDEYRGRTQALKTVDGAAVVDGGISGYGTMDVRLVVKGSGDLRIVYDAVKGGTYETTIPLK